MISLKKSNICNYSNDNGFPRLHHATYLFLVCCPVHGLIHPMYLFHITMLASLYPLGCKQSSLMCASKQSPRLFTWCITFTKNILEFLKKPYPITTSLWTTYSWHWVFSVMTTAPALSKSCTIISGNNYCPFKVFVLSQPHLFRGTLFQALEWPCIIALHILYILILLCSSPCSFHK